MKAKETAKKGKSSKKDSKVKEKSKRGDHPENAKKKLRVPMRNNREPFKTLIILRRQATVSADKAYSFEMRKLGGEHKGFLKLDLPGDYADTPAHKVGMPELFSTTLYGPPVKEKTDHIYYLYNTYNTLDDLTKFDIYRRTAHYSALIPKLVLRRKKPSDELKLTGMAVLASLDVRKRREHFKLRGRWRPEYSNFGRRMLESPRALIAKLQKYSHPYFGQLIASRKLEAKNFSIAAIQHLKDGLRNNKKETKGRIVKFLGYNHVWMKDRMKCYMNPIFTKFPRNKLYSNVVNHHHKMPYRKRGDQDLFSEFNFLPSHLAFSAHFCRVMKSFKVNITKEGAVIQKVSELTSLIRVHPTRYSYFPAVSIVQYSDNDELQSTLPRIPRKAPSIAAVSGYSSDSSGSTATDTPLDWELDWKITDKELEHRMNFLGDTTRQSVKMAAERCFNERKWRESIRRKKLLQKEDGRFELQGTVPIFRELTKMHPPLIYCKLKSMELKKLRRSRLPEDSDMPSRMKQATEYLFRKRKNFLEKTLPCRDDSRIFLTDGWKVFASRENPAAFENVARILKQRSSWVSKNCISRSSTIPRCDKLPMSTDGQHKKLFVVLILPLTLALVITTMAMISFL